MDNFGKIKIDAHVVKQLGDELITDHEQAILEIIKNSYDADASYCHVEIDTTYVEEVNGEKLCGLISFEDDGHGMSESDVDRGWLTISYSGKRQLKDENRKTVKRRNYQGDKGLGRLSSMRLGRLLRISTFKDGENYPTFAELDWDSFSVGNTLDSIDVVLGCPIDRDLPIGTKLEVIGLNDRRRWNEEYSDKRLQAQLSKLLSPYGHLSGFLVSVTIDGTDIDLFQLPEDIRLLSQAEVEYSFDGEKLELIGRIRLPFFKGMKGDRTKEYDRYIKPDDGKSLFNWLTSVPRLKNNYEMSYSSEDGWFIEFRSSKGWEYVNDPKNEIANPGPFSGRWNYVFFSGPAFSELESIQGRRLGPLAESIRAYRGIRLYRDGFAIGNTQGDWVGLSTEKTAGLGFYSLRPDNTFGYVYFDGYKTRGLKETSDRQGLIENVVFWGLKALLKEIIDFSNVFLNVSRKQANEFSDNERVKSASVASLPTASEAIRNIETVSVEIKNNFKAFNERSDNLKNQFSKVEARIDKSKGDLLLDEEAKAALADIELYVSNLNRSFLQFKDFFDQKIGDVKNLEVSSVLVAQELKLLNERLESYYELAAVGLSASTLSHDINSQLDSIYKSCTSIMSTLKSLDAEKRRPIVSFVNRIRATTRTIAKDVSLLNPMLRGRRERLDEVVLSEAIKDYVDIVGEGLKSRDIVFDLDVIESITVSFNPGKLFQVLDNLVRNSEYWLKHFSSDIPEMVIYIRTTKSGFQIFDSGKGVRDEVADTIFEMFVSDKSDGQGLGLYIVSNLLSERGGSISLLDDRNGYDRRYIFDVRFS